MAKLTSLEDAMRVGPVSASARIEGVAGAHEVHRSADPFALVVNIVRFEPGARNHWHSHSGGQLLHVVDGQGWVQVRNEPARAIHLGDSVSIAPDEIHWHGAAANSHMAHLAVSAGETRWFEDPPPTPAESDV